VTGPEILYGLIAGLEYSPRVLQITCMVHFFDSYCTHYCT